MRKRLLSVLCVLLALAVSLGVANLASAFAAAENHAVNAAMWVNDAFEDKTVFDSAGIHYKDFGAGQNYAGNSYKQLLPKSYTVTLKFKTSSDQPATFKIVFADPSEAINGKALKPWEIDGQVENVALEIKKDAVFLWQYNADNVYGTNKQLPVTAATVNYFDGAEHTLELTAEATAEGVVTNLKIDSTVHFDGVIASSKLNCNSVFTMGMCATALVSEEFSVSWFSVEQNKPDEIEVDPANALFDAENWLISSAVSDEVVLDGETGTLTVSGFGKGEYAATYAERLPVAYTLNLKLAYNGPSEAPANRKGLRILIANRADTAEGSQIAGGDRAYWYQIDADGNVWLMKRVDDEESAVVGDWVPELVNGAAVSCSIEIKPVWDGDASYIECRFRCGTKIVYGEIEDMDAATDNYLTIGGSNDSAEAFGFTLTYLKITDQYDSAPADCSTSAGNWSVIGATVDEKGVTAADGAAYMVTTDAAELPVIGEISFTMNSDAHGGSWSNWIRIGLGTYAASGWNNDADPANGKIYYLITLGSNFYTFDSYVGENKTLSTATPNTTNLVNEKEHVFRFVTSVVDGNFTLNYYLDDVLQLTVTETGNPFADAGRLYFFVRQTGGTGAVSVSKLYGVSEETAIVKNLMRAIYEVPFRVTADNLTGVKAQIEALSGQYDALSTTLQYQVENVGYLDFVGEKVAALEAEEADKAAAKAVSDELAAIVVPETITAENAEALKAAVAAAKEHYEALTETQKAYVAGYGVIADAEEKIAAYEKEAADRAAAKAVSDAIAAISVPAEWNEDNVTALKAAVAAAKSQYEALTAEQKAYVANYGIITDAEAKIKAYEDAKNQEDPENTPEGGCNSSLGIGSVLGLIALAGAAIAVKKREN